MDPVCVLELTLVVEVEGGERVRERENEGERDGVGIAKTNTETKIPRVFLSSDAPVYLDAYEATHARHACMRSLYDNQLTASISLSLTLNVSCASCIN